MRYSFTTALFILASCALGAQTISVNTASQKGEIKIMHAVNNGPVKPRMSRFFKAAGIPYARVHDANLYTGYGAPYTVDITAIFHDFDANPNKESSYDFARTDEYLRRLQAGGAKVFYRLGQSIENGTCNIKKYGAHPPKDFKKWAVICEHIIRHYTEGWADGFTWDIQYWEIWNEADNKLESNPSCWVAPFEDFFSLYEITAKHLKACFPHLKIGGPALVGKENDAKKFVEEMARRGVTMDFFSWHGYPSTPEPIAMRAAFMRKLLDDNGYEATESILDEWNYMKDFRENREYSVNQHGLAKGASFCAAVMALMQRSPVDMLMYYDARPATKFNGMFDVDGHPLKDYWAFYSWNKLIELKTEVEAVSSEKDIYVGAAASKGKAAILVARYNNDDNITSDKEVTIRIDGITPSKVNIRMVDEYMDFGDYPVEKDEKGNFVIQMEPRSFAFISLE